MTRDGTKTDQSGAIAGAEDLRRLTRTIIDRTPVIDVHTHLFSPPFGPLNLSGIDELLTYHYLIAETFRSSRVAPEAFWAMDKTSQADLVWRTLFVENTPISEAARGVVTVLATLGLNPSAPDLREARAFFASRHLARHLESVLGLSGVSGVVMTNDPFDPIESEVWEKGAALDGRFHASLRLDPLINDWPAVLPKLEAQGFHVTDAPNWGNAREARRFLEKWIARMRPCYMAVSLPGCFSFPSADARNWLIQDVVLPTARQHDLPLALMVGVRRAVNPALREAGDGVRKADMGAIERLCAENPGNRFLVTLLSRENQHELCVAARKFSNLMPFGCWWFLNNPSIIAEITLERLELLGVGFIPQHSDARVLEQLIYKWKHSRQVIADCLAESYGRLHASGGIVSVGQIERDVARLFSGNFCDWVGLSGEAIGREEDHGFQHH